MKRKSWPRQRRITAITVAALWVVTLATVLYLAAAALLRADSNRTTLVTIAAVIVLAVAAMTLRAIRRIPPRSVPKLPKSPDSAEKKMRRRLTPRRWETAAHEAGIALEDRSNPDQCTIRTPRVTAVSSTLLGVRLDLATLPGQPPADIEKRLDHLASALQVPIRARITGPSTLAVTAVLRQPLRDGVNAEEWTEMLLRREHTLNAIPTGVDEEGEIVTSAPAKLPHFLEAGSTGAGKSVVANAIIAAIVTCAESPQLILVDPKRVELSHWHAAALRVATEPDDLAPAVADAVAVMRHRYDVMAGKGIKNLANAPDLLRELGGPLLVVVDEIADYLGLTGKDGGRPLAEIAQLGRAACVFLHLATQNPKAELFSKSNGTETLKANLNDVYGLRVIRRSDSEVIFGTGHEANAADTPADLPGSFYRLTTGTRLARAPYLTDDQIDRIATACATDRTVSDLLEGADR